jgi:hypothetical protein
MQFLNPIWFFALAAISIPVIIHLWNTRPGKTLKIGSISLITEASKSTKRSFRLLDILLLVVRCLLLALLAMLLAAPVWQKYASAQKGKGWVLIPKESFKETYQNFKPTIDSLDKAGYEFRYFNKGFAKQELKTILADSALKDTTINANYWSLVKQLENQVGNASVYLFTQNGIDHFKGGKPKVKLNSLHWQTYTAKDSVAKWIDRAFMTNNGAIKVAIGNSTPLATYFTTQTIQSGSNNDVTVNVQNGQPFVSLKNTAQSVAVDTSTLRIAIYTDKYQLDAGYLKAALSAATAFNGAKTTIKQYNNATIPRGQTWLFWLSEQPVKPDVLKSGKHIFQYEAGKVTDVNSWIDPGHIALTKMVSASTTQEAIWKDGFGKPVLGLDGYTYHFYSRFNPLWNDLVWSDDFPKLMLKLLLGNRQSQPKDHERRILSNSQLQPEILAQSMSQSSFKTNQQASLSKYFWLLLVLLFIAERILSHKKTTNNG